MPRPLRIEYENAYYHVINRGRTRHRIFHGEDYYTAFTSTLEEAHSRFGIKILSYCLMPNLYHLLVKTPEANLGRAMRHINGVYTQRYNRLKKTDGSLFRGRYKAILVEEDSYQLQVSRYIHCTPLEAGLVKHLSDFPWSSYAYFVEKKAAPPWLDRQEVYQQLGVKSRHRDRYRAFVEMGVDDEINEFYGMGNQKAYLGGENFRKWAIQQRDTADSEVSQASLRQYRASIEEVVAGVAMHFKVDEESIITTHRGRVENNIPRWVAMYIAQHSCGIKLSEIAAYLGLKRTGSIPTTIAKLKECMEEDARLVKKVKKIKKQYDI